MLRSAAKELYHYPTSNHELIKIHDLEPHFEGGFFKQTVGVTSRSVDGQRVQTSSGPGTDGLRGGNSAARGKGNDETTDATSIYYLLTPDGPRGRMHMNDNVTFHLHHCGRALYTLISPAKNADSLPTVHRVVMGSDLTKGEVTQLFVPGGWWKASEIPEEDLSLMEGETLRDRVGCLISEVVVPGWNPEQHQFLTEEKLRALWGGQDGWQEYERYLRGPK